MQKSGGEEALTKHVTTEEATKCPIGLEEANRIDPCAVNLLEKNVIVIGDTRVSLSEEDCVRIPSVKAKRSLKKSRLAKITEKLYNLEPCVVSEKSLHIDLGLYQMEEY